MSGISGAGNLILDGLVLHLDAANPKSYVSGSTTWNDLSGNRNNGTLVNGVGYSSSNAGTLVFDGTNDYVNGGNLGTFYQSGTIMYWMNASVWENYRNPFHTKYSGSNDGIRFEEYTGGGFSVVIGPSTGGFDGFSYSNNFTFISNTWYLITLTWDKTTNYVSGWVNNSNRFTNSPMTPSKWPSTLPSITIGGGFDSGRYFKGSFGQTMIYNRALSSTEVLQNYNTLKNRYI